MAEFKIIIREGKSYTGELGAADTRRIEITGTGAIETYGVTVDGMENTISSQLIASGWKIYNLDFEQTDIFTLDGMEFKINIVAEVSNQFDNQQHIDFLANIFNTQTNWLGNRYFSGVKLFATSTDANGNKQAAGKIGNPLDDEDDESILTTLFGTSGVTVGVIGAILVITFILKR